MSSRPCSAHLLCTWQLSGAEVPHSVSVEAHREEKRLSTAVCSASRKGSWDIVGTHSRSVEMNDPFYGAKGLPGEFPFLQLFCAVSASQICQTGPSLTEKDHLFDQKVCKMDIASLFPPSAYNGYFWNLNMSAPKNPFFFSICSLGAFLKISQSIQFEDNNASSSDRLDQRSTVHLFDGLPVAIKKKISKVLYGFL